MTLSTSLDPLSECVQLLSYRSRLFVPFLFHCPAPFSISLEGFSFLFCFVCFRFLFLRLKIDIANSGAVNVNESALRTLEARGKRKDVANMKSFPQPCETKGRRQSPDSSSLSRAVLGK